ncbi:MAG: hypothetical protein ACI406_00145, partial [Victivallis vadensis]
MADDFDAVFAENKLGGIEGGLAAGCNFVGEGVVKKRLPASFSRRGLHDFPDLIRTERFIENLQFIDGAFQMAVFRVETADTQNTLSWPLLLHIFIFDVSRFVSVDVRRAFTVPVGK